MKKETRKGLYQSEHEHDACGVGMVVNIHGNKSHELVDHALKVLENMRHRGAEVGKDGDGAGITRGLQQASANGLSVARSILRSLDQPAENAGEAIE